MIRGNHESCMTRAQKRIEEIHQRLMDIRDSTPMRRGSVVREQEYVGVYRKAYKESRLSDFYAAAERYRHFLQDRDLKKKENVNAINEL